MTQLSAGVAKVNLTPPVGTYLQGYSRGKPAAGILDDLHARALVLDNGEKRLALVAADLIGLDESSVKRIRRLIKERVGLAEADVLLACSHTHCGPAVMALCSWTDPPNPSTVEEIERKIAGAVAIAVGRLQPVRLAFGIGQMDYNVNRRRPDLPGTPMLPNPDGPVDRRVKVLRLQTDGQDEPLAVVFLYACHATSMGGTLLISGEHPGAACAFVEQAYGGATAALYLQGCTGDARPNVTDEEGRFRSATPEEMRRLGWRLGAEVVRVAETLAGGDRPPAYGDDATLQAASRRVRLPFASEVWRLQLPAAELRRSLRAATSAYERGWAREMLNRLKAGPLPEHEPAEVQVLRVGGQLFVGLPGEPFTELGWRIEEQLPRGTRPQATTFVVGYANANVGYLCTAASYAEGGYEPATSYRAYARHAPFTPDVEHLLVQAAVTLGRRLGE